MELKFLGTGSKGNCIALVGDQGTILVDCGIPKTRIEKQLIENDINPGEIKAIFITHTHKDHIAGLPLAAKWDIPVFAPLGEFEKLDVRYKFPVERHTLIAFEEAGFSFMAFPTHHDSYNSVGYAFAYYDGVHKVSVCLDTGRVDNQMLTVMKGSTHIVIESNHDEDMLAASERPDSVKARILSDIGHLSNDQAAEALAKLVQGNGERIYLAHLSSEANMKALAMTTVWSRLAKNGLTLNKHFTLETV